MNPDTDADLLAPLRSGDEDAFGVLVRRYHPRLIRLAGSFVRRNDLAEDVAQETWLAVLRGIDRFEGRSTLRTWLFQICANRARSIAATEQRIVPVDPGSEMGEESFAADGSWATPAQPCADFVVDRIEDAELLAAIRCAIRQLPETQLQVVTLRDVEGLSASDVCTVLSISEANQRVLLHRGRTRVRTSLGRSAMAGR